MPGRAGMASPKAGVERLDLAGGEEETGEPCASSRAAREVNARLIGSLRTRLSSLDDARDVAQEAYLRLIDDDGRAPPASPHAYLFRIAQNLATDLLRRRRHRETLGDPGYELHADPTASPERAAEARRVLEQLPEALAALPERTAEAFRLVRLEHLTFAEAAIRMQLTERMVRIHVSRALLHCQQWLDLPGLESP